jgi:hypothetical protein
VGLQKYARPVASVLRYAAYTLALSACTSFSAAETMGGDQADQAGSAGPGACGDVRSDADNCGYCGHACGEGAACTDGRCPSLEVLRADGIKAFATDGNALFYIDDQNVFGCRGGSCAPFLTALEVMKVAPMRSTGSLAPSAITMTADRVLVADDGFRAIFSCPIADTCSYASLGLVDDRNSDGAPIRGLTAGLIGVAWTRGNLVRGSAFPPAGTIVDTYASAETPATQGAVSILADSVAGAFWAGAAGVHRAEIVGGPAERISSQRGVDLANDGKSVYLASADGLFRFDAPDRREARAAEGSFTKVVADARSVIAVQKRNGSATLVDVRGGAAYVLATTDDVVGLALAGDYVYFATTSEIRRVRR